MPESAESVIVINTSPLIPLVAAWGDLTRLEALYQQIWVPFEVSQEILQGGATQFAVSEFEQATWLKKQTTPQPISPFLLNTLDLGEASLIQLALDSNLATVCLDEAVGRRVARLNGLTLTGSIGILLRAKQQDPALSVKVAIANMLKHNILLSQTVITFALTPAGEQ